MTLQILRGDVFLVDFDPPKADDLPKTESTRGQRCLGLALSPNVFGKPFAPAHTA